MSAYFNTLQSSKMFLIDKQSPRPIRLCGRFNRDSQIKHVPDSRTNSVLHQSLHSPSGILSRCPTPIRQPLRIQPLSDGLKSWKLFLSVNQESVGSCLDVFRVVFVRQTCFSERSLVFILGWKWRRCNSAPVRHAILFSFPVS